MLINDYILAEEADKIKWLNSIKMKVGLPYFGGKSRIGKYLFNNIFNLAVQMKKDGKPADIFIDAFTGGGKMGLSVPVGWFKTVVINDLDYGVYSFYKCCQDDEKYIQLIFMIEEIGKIMCADLFYEIVWIRTFGPGADKYNEKDKPNPVQANEVIDPVVAAALTYWVASSSFNCITDPKSATYNLTHKINETEYNKEEERRNIDKVVNKARRTIPKIHNQLNKENYIIENLDYRELIKKYNGFSYKDLENKKYKANKNFKEQNKLWYFDPPYHPWTLYGGLNAPYPNTFNVEDADEMTKILHGDQETTYGKLLYFIKSDYSPKEALEIAKKQEADGMISNRAQTILDIEKDNNKVSKAFEPLEEFPFMEICVGTFDKGATEFINEIGDTKKATGNEYIWTRGFPEGYEKMQGVEAT